MEYMEYVWYLLAAAAVVFPWYILSSTIDRLPKRQERAKQKAIEKGHVVTATLVKQYGRDWNNPSLQSQCKYKYEYDGKTYSYTAYSDYPPDTLELYFIRTPRKAAVGNAINASEKPWLLRFIIVLAIVIFVAKCL